MINQTDIMDAVRQCRDRFRQVGYVLIALGVLAILFPLVFSIAAKAVLGWVFMLTGAALLYHWRLYTSPSPRDRHKSPQPPSA